MSTIHQLLSAPVKLPVLPATEEDRLLFADKQIVSGEGHIYHLNLTSGQEFAGYIDSEKNEAFFRPVNNLDVLGGLREVQYGQKYFYNRPEIVCQLNLSDDCSADEKNLYHTIFDSQSVNFSNPDLAHFKNHDLGQFTKKILPCLGQIAYGKRLQMSGQKSLQTVLKGATIIQEKTQERR